jgi:nitroreductase
MIKAISERRTCRDFDPSKPVPRDILSKIVSAGVNAPTGINAQSFDFYVVSRQSALDAIAAAAFAQFPPEIVAKFGLSGPEKIFYGATAAIFLIPARKQAENCVNYDLGIITNSISLAATDLGVQSAIIGSVGECPLEVLKANLGQTVGGKPVAVALGYQKEGWAPAPRELTSPIRYLA